jgi:predicted N-formylglutamate amidohydrolase
MKTKNIGEKGPVMRDTPHPPPVSPDDAAYEIHNPDGKTPIILICDHASNAIPAALGNLGLPVADRSRHIAYDIGVRGMCVRLCQLLDAPLMCSTFSRLLIDPNRGENDPTLIMQLYDRTIIPGNVDISIAERTRRLNTYYRPYHEALKRLILARHPPQLLIAIHSFTPQLTGGPPRPWQISVLWDQDTGTADALLELLRLETDLVVGANAPYKGSLPGDTMDRHGTKAERLHALIEIRNDQIASETGEQYWASRLAPILAELACIRIGS